jgi:hypothetical protein
VIVSHEDRLARQPGATCRSQVLTHKGHHKINVCTRRHHPTVRRQADTGTTSMMLATRTHVVTSAPSRRAGRESEGCEG